MISILFIVSATSVILFLLQVILRKNIPVPLLHMLGVNFGNSYIYTPCLLFQVWFWATKFGVI